MTATDEVENDRNAVGGPVLVLGTTEAEDVSCVSIGFRDGCAVYASLERGVQQRLLYRVLE